MVGYWQICRRNGYDICFDGITQLPVLLLKEMREIGKVKRSYTHTHTHGTQRRTGGIFLPLKRWFDRASCHVRVFRYVRNLAAAGLVGSVCFIDWTPDPVTVLVGITVMHLMI